MRPTRLRTARRPVRRALALVAVLTLAGGAATAGAASGDLDPTFGDSGVATADLDGSESVAAMAQRPDGRLVLAGTLVTGDGGSDGFVAQMGADSGRLETGFGLGLGWTRIDRGADEGVQDVALRPDGRVVVAGFAGEDGLVARLRAVEGTPDPSFGGGDGLETLPFGATDTLTSVALQPDGRPVVAGYRFDNGTSDGIFARLLEDPGTFDDTFAGGTGAVSQDFGSTDMQVDDIALQPDGRIVYAGNIQTGGSRNVLIGRLENPDAFDDETFGGGTGRTIIDAGGFDYVVSVAIQPDGRIVAAGARLNVGGTPDEFVVVRVLANGLPDPSLSGDGLATVRFGGDAFASSVVLQPDGKILVAGTAAGAGGVDDIAVARLLTDGSPDPGFGTAGRVTLDLGAVESGNAIALRPDGRIVVAGITKPTPMGSGDIAVVRLLGGDPPVPAAPAGPGGPGGPGGAAGPTAVCAGQPATIVGTAGADSLRGTPGPDVIAALGGDDTVTGLGGNDLVCGGAGRDRLAGGPGADRLVGGPGADILTGGLGRDRLEGGAGPDRLVGGRGLDRLLGGAGRNTAIQ